jgi:hypothetical protein
MKLKISLNNDAGELDSFQVEDDQGDDSLVANALIDKLTGDWCLLTDGDTITVREVE